MTTFRSVRWVLVVALLGGACSSILGIEDIHDGPDPSDAEGGENGSGGSSSGKGGVERHLGLERLERRVGHSRQGRLERRLGRHGHRRNRRRRGRRQWRRRHDGRHGRDSRDGRLGDPTVRGRIITTWNQPVPNITVMIGDAEADTNANGEFEIPDVAATYDAKFVLNYDLNGIELTATCISGSPGVTRRCRCTSGLPSRSTNISATPQNLTGTDFTNRKLLLGLGGPEGENNHNVSLPAGIGQSGATWQGPEMTNVTAHALLFEHDANSLPTTYRSYDQIARRALRADAAPRSCSTCRTRPSARGRSPEP